MPSHARSIMLLCIVLLGLPAHAAQICKWVDDKGVVQYSNLRPPGRDCSAVIEVLHHDPVERQRAEERARRQQEQLKAIEAARSEQDRRAAEQARSEADRAARCADARAELQFLQGAYGMRLAIAGRPGADALHFLDDKERGAVTDAWRQRVDYWCLGRGDEPADAAAQRAVGVPPPPRRR
jgi:hypothetical protein